MKTELADVRFLPAMDGFGSQVDEPKVKSGVRKLRGIERSKRSKSFLFLFPYLSELLHPSASLSEYVSLWIFYMTAATRESNFFFLPLFEFSKFSFSRRNSKLDTLLRSSVQPCGWTLDQQLNHGWIFAWLDLKSSVTPLHGWRLGLASRTYCIFLAWNSQGKLAICTLLEDKETTWGKFASYAWPPLVCTNLSFWSEVVIAILSCTCFPR